MTHSPMTTLLLGVIIGCVVTTLIHSLTVSCVQCASSSSRSLVGLDKLSSVASSDRFRARQLGVITSETSCATLRLQLETANGAVSPSKTNKRRKRNVDSTNGNLIVMFVLLLGACPCRQLDEL